MDNSKEEITDIKVQRRIIDFFNKLKRPEELIEKTKVDKDIAKKIIDKRYEYFQFQHFEQIRKIINPQILKGIIHWFTHRFYGHWNELYETPEEEPVHAALLRTGKVLFIPHGHSGYVPETFLWNPEAPSQNDAFSYPDNQPDDNLYCSGHAFCSDGKLLVAGGGGGGPANVDRAWIFDPVAGNNGVWTQTVKDMHYDRWYPTVVNIGGRRLLVIGGYPNDGKLEIYNEYSGRFEEVTVPVGNEQDFIQTYPGMHLVPGGEIIYTRTGFGNSGSRPYLGSMNLGNLYFRFTGTYTGEWIDIANFYGNTNRVKGMSTPLFFGPLAGSYVAKVLIVGGNGSNTTEIINFSTVVPSWEAQSTMPGVGRNNVNIVLLPDNTVFVLGGATINSDEVLECLLYNPLTNVWSPMDSLKYKRAYHSVALLLPSGKVMVTGDSNRIIEVFSPPYMFQGTPPEISNFPNTVHHGHIFNIDVTQGSEIEKVALVRPMAVTHQTDTEQRVINLYFTRNGNTLSITAPDGNHPHPIAPRGYYMLFVINSDGVPSEGKIMWLH